MDGRKGVIGLLVMAFSRLRLGLIDGRGDFCLTGRSSFGIPEGELWGLE